MHNCALRLFVVSMLCGCRESDVRQSCDSHMMVGRQISYRGYQKNILSQTILISSHDRRTIVSQNLYLEKGCTTLQVRLIVSLVQNNINNYIDLVYILDGRTSSPTVV